MKKTIIISGIALCLLSACQMIQPEKQAAPLDLSRRYFLVDQEGRPAGTAVFRPVGNGEIRDHNGELVGIIVKPE